MTKGKNVMCLRLYKVVWSCFQIILPSMFIPSVALIFSLLLIVPSTKCGILKNKATDLISESFVLRKFYSMYLETNRTTNPSSKSIDNKIALEKEVESGCQWRGKAPFCKGSCIGWEVQERIASSEKEKIFGLTCWTGQKTFCCLWVVLPRYLKQKTCGIRLLNLMACGNRRSFTKNPTAVD